MDGLNEIFELYNILTRAEIRVYLFIKELSPQIISSKKLGLIGRGETVSIDPEAEKKYGHCLISRIRKKLGDNHRIKNEYGSGYYYEEERKGE